MPDAITASEIQTIDVFLRENGVKGDLLDSNGRHITSAPAIARGGKVKLILHIYPSNPSVREQYSEWPEDSAFSLVASKVYVDSAEGSSEQDISPEVLAATTVEVQQDGSIAATFTVTNTTELANLMGGIGGLAIGMELSRFNSGETVPAYILQFPLVVLNRRGLEGTGTPTALPDAYYTKVQIDALLEGIDPESAAQAIATAVSNHNNANDAHSALFAGKADAAHTHTVSDITDFGVAWGDITGKPESFTPSAHTHSSTDISQSVTAIAAATTEYTLADGGAYTHSPSSAPIYTLPAVTDNTKTHEITVDVKFSASALSVAFQTTGGASVPIQDSADITIAANDVWTFLCRWNALGTAWTVYPVKEG